MTLFFVPLASLVLGAVPTSLEGIASGANAAFRELGGVLGIAVLGAVFSAHGSYASGQDYVHGMTAAVYAGAVVVAVGAIAALMIPGRRRAEARRLALVGSEVGGTWRRRRRIRLGRSRAGSVPPVPAMATMVDTEAGRLHVGVTGRRLTSRWQSVRVMRGARASAARRMSVAWGRNSESGRLRWTRTPRSTWAMVPTPKREATSISSASSTAYPSARPHFSSTQRGAAVSPASGCRSTTDAGRADR